MKKIGNWFFPDHERHLIEWMATPKGYLVINGRESYQGKKQLRAMDFVPVDRRRTAIDIGGHVGLWSYNLAHWFKKVESFEPVEAHRECFLKNLFESENMPIDKVAKTGFSTEKITLHPFALGDREGTVSITTETGSSGNSFVNVKGKGEVSMRTLDSFEFEDVDFCKCDCEGYEEFIFRGAEETIRRCRPVVIVEQKRDMSATRFGLAPLSAVKFLSSLGYKVVAEISGDYILVHQP